MNLMLCCLWLMPERALPVPILVLLTICVVKRKKVFWSRIKPDGFDGDAHCAEFYSLALGEVYQIAASHGRGVTSLLEKALAPFFEETGKSPEEEAADEDAAYWAAFEGKDVEVESEEDELTGEDRYADLPIKFAIIGRPNVGKSTLTNRMLGEDRVIVFDLPGTTRDSIYIPLERDEQQYIVIDTAGVRKKKKSTKPSKSSLLLKHCKRLKMQRGVVID